MVSGTKRLAVAAFATVITTGIVGAYAAELLPNGDFEAASLIGWTASHTTDGIVELITEGECFSTQDTTRISLAGSYAALIGSGPSSRRSSIGILTSDAFIAGDGVVFTTLTGTRDGYRIDRPIEFEVRILNTDGDALISQRFSTSVVRLKEGCPSEPRDGRFYVHYFDTRKFLDQEIRIQFRQNTNTGGIQPFTLIDQVIRFDKGEGPLFTSKPVAVAGISQTRRGVPRLDASHSFDPDQGPLPLGHTWRLDGEDLLRFGERPCLDDLADGTYTATLFANDGFHAVSDSLVFAVATGESTEVAGDTDDDDETDDGDDSNGDITVTIAGCDQETESTDAAVDDATAGDDTEDSVDGEDGDADEDPDDSENAAPVIDLDADDDTVSGANYLTTYDTDDGPVAIADDDIEISDDDGDDIVSATITLENAEDGDELVIDTASVPSAIDVTTNSASITLSGAAGVDDYEDAILAISFRNTTENPETSTQRLIRVVVNDDISDSNSAFAYVSVDDD